MKDSKPKILFWDIETSLLTGKTFKIWDTNILDLTEDWFLLSISYRWGHEKKTHVKALCDFKGYKQGNDKEELLVKEMWKLIDEASIIVHHNGNKFDLKKARAKFLEFGLPPHSPVQTIDTLLVARREFGFTSNKLADLGKKLGIGKKTPHTGLRLWLECMEGDKKAWNLMKKYSKQDTILLYDLYQKLIPWMTNTTNLGILVEDGTPICPKCGHNYLVKRGFSTTNAGKYQRMRCKKCQGYSRLRTKEKGSGNPLTHG